MALCDVNRLGEPSAVLRYRCAAAPEISRKEGLSTRPGWVGRQAGWVWVYAEGLCVQTTYPAYI